MKPISTRAIQQPLDTGRALLWAVGSFTSFSFPRPYMYRLATGMQTEVLTGMSEQPGPWLRVTEMPHSSLSLLIRPTMLSSFSQKTYQGPTLRVSTWGVLSAQRVYSVRSEQGSDSGSKEKSRSERYDGLIINPQLLRCQSPSCMRCYVIDTMLFRGFLLVRKKDCFSCIFLVTWESIREFKLTDTGQSIMGYYVVLP